MGGGHAPPGSTALRTPLPHLRGQRQCQSASRCQLRRLALRARTTAAPWRVEGPLCRCSLQSAGQHSSPDGYLADSAASPTPPQSQRQPPRFRRPGPRLHPERTQRPSRYAKADPPKPLGKRLAFHSAVAKPRSLGRASHREKLDPCSSSHDGPSGPIGPCGQHARPARTLTRRILLRSGTRSIPPTSALRLDSAPPPLRKTAETGEEGKWRRHPRPAHHRS